MFELSKFNSCHKGSSCKFNHNKEDIMDIKYIIDNYKNLKFKFEENNKVIQSIKEENEFLKKEIYNFNNHLEYINSQLLENNITLINTQDNYKLLFNQNKILDDKISNLSNELMEAKKTISKLEFCKNDYDNICLIAINSDNYNKEIKKEMNELIISYHNLKQNYDYLHFENINKYKEINIFIEINNKILYLDEYKKYNEFKNYKFKIEEIILYYKNALKIINEINRFIEFIKNENIPKNIKDNFLHIFYI
jgi:hypothetical protein